MTCNLMISSLKGKISLGNILLAVFFLVGMYNFIGYLFSFILFASMGICHTLQIPYGYTRTCIYDEMSSFFDGGEATSYDEMIDELHSDCRNEVKECETRYADIIREADDVCNCYSVNVKGTNEYICDRKCLEAEMAKSGYVPYTNSKCGNIYSDCAQELEIELERAETVCHDKVTVLEEFLFHTILHCTNMIWE